MSRLSVDPTRCARPRALMMLGVEAITARPPPPGVPPYRWHDDVWLRQREREGLTVSPLSIYRLYPAVWRRDAQGAPLGWEALIDQLVPYVADLGFTHIELAQISGAAADGSFCGFIDACHEGGIGVILKWPVEPGEKGDQEGANDSHVDSALGQALDWIERFHLDGLHLTGQGEDGDEVAREALLQGIAQRHRDVLLLIDHRPAHLPCNALTCNTAWSRATLAYLSEPPENRWACHDMLTGGFTKSFDTHYLLPLADADSAEGHSSWLGRMPGDTWQKFANLRACMSLMWAHPGKKLLGMGTEFAQGKGWRQAGELDWSLLDDPCHAGVLRLVADLNRLYVNEPALYSRDIEPGSFAWIIDDDAANSVIAFLRYGDEGTAPLLVIINFTPRVHHDYRLGAPALGTWREVLNSDSIFYGGSNVGNANDVKAQLSPSHGYPASVSLTLPPLAALFLRQGDWPA